MSNPQTTVLKTQITVVLLALVLALASGCATSQPKDLSKEDRFALFMQLGNAALTEGDPTGALNYLLKAEQEKPESPQVHHSLALAYYQKHVHAKALEEAKKATTLDSDYSEANNTYGRLLVEANKPYQAEPYLQKAAADPLYRDAFKAQTNIGIIHYRLQEFSRAQEDFTHAIEASPQNACVAYYYRGHIALRASNFKEAISDYEKATQKYCTNFPDAHLALGIAYQDQREFDLARKTYLEIAKNYPNTSASEQALTRLKTIP